MSTLGSTSKPTVGQEWSGPNLNEQVAEAHTFPSGGPWRVTRIGIWVAGKSSSAQFRGVVWNAARSAVLGQTAAFTAAGLPFGVGNCANYERDVTTQFVVAGGATVYIGWWRNQNDVGQWGRSSGSHYDDTETGGSPAPMSGETLDTGGGIGAYLQYQLDNVAPLAPTSVKLEGAASGSTLSGSDNLWALTFNSNETIASYDYQIDTTTGSGVVPDWASLVANVAARTDGISGASTSSVLTHTLTRGQWYAMRVRTTDTGGLVSAWSGVYYFRVNSIPVVGTRTPIDSALAYIWNLGTDLQVWTSAGEFAKPRVQFVYTDADAQQMSAYRVKLWNDNAGAKGTQLYDTGKVLAVAAVGDTITVDLPQALVMGTQYWWSIEVWDSLDESSGSVDSSTAFRIKVRWGQAIYEYNAGAGSSGWNFIPGNMTGTQVVFLYASATGASGAGRSTWATTIGALNPNAYVNVMVRLATSADGVDSTLDSMRFTYLGNSTTPDDWATSGGTWVLDANIRRYGTQSLKASINTTVASDSLTYPVRNAPNGNDIPVVPGTPMVFSAWVKTGQALTGGNKIQLRVYMAGATTTELVSSYTDVARRETLDSSTSPDGWQRLRLGFTVPLGVSFVRPALEFVRAASQGTISFWVDAVKLEEGTVATAWTPGFVADAVVLDAGGIMVDGLAGGIFRLRGSAGTVRDTVQLNTNGLLFGGDTPLYSPAASVLRLDSALRLNADAQIRRSAAKVLTLEDNAGAALTALDLKTLLLRYGGSSFPASPATNDIFPRTDLNMWFKFDGTRWLCQCTHTVPLQMWVTASMALSATTTNRFAVAWPVGRGLDIYLESIECLFQIEGGGTALDGSNKWVGTLVSQPSGTTLATLTINSGASAALRTMDVFAGGFLDITSGDIGAQLTWTKTGTPGNLEQAARINFRFVGP